MVETVRARFSRGVRVLARGFPCLVLSGLCACSVLPGLAPAEERYFQLAPELSAAPPAAGVAVCPRSVNLRPIASNPFLASRKIVFGSRPTERGFYRYASWIEPPPSRLLVLLRSRMEALGQIRSVTPVIAGARGDFELSLELREFYHDLSSTPGQARIVIAADLLETAHRTVVASRIVDVSTPVQEFDSAGAVAALSAGAGKALTELSEWVAASCAASLPSGAGQQVTD